MERNTKISFRMSDDKTKTKIFLNGMYLGFVQLDIWTQKWTMMPSFKLPYSFDSVKKNKFDSSYKAGKDMIELYNFLFPDVGDEEENKQELGIKIDEMLVFLRTRK